MANIAVLLPEVDMVKKHPSNGLIGCENMLSGLSHMEALMEEL